MLAICYWAWGLPLYMVNTHSETPLEKMYLFFVSGCQLKIAPGFKMVPHVCGYLGLTHSNYFYLQIHLLTLSLFYLYKSVVSCWEINYFQCQGVCVLNLNYLCLKLFFLSICHSYLENIKIKILKYFKIFKILITRSHIFLVNTYIIEKLTMNLQKKNLP